MTLPGTNLNNLLWSAVISHAFLGCSSLTTVEVKNSGVVYGDSVFPNLETLTLRSTSDSTTEEYTIGKKIKFVAYDTDNGLYLYKISCMGDVGKLTGLQIHPCHFAFGICYDITVGYLDFHIVSRSPDFR